MANEVRLRTNFVGGLIEDNPLTSSATTLTSSALSVVPIVTSSSHFPIVLDPDGVFGSPEIAWITLHASNANTATIVRAQEGSNGRQHTRDTPWLHGPTVLDYLNAAPAVVTATYAMATADFAVFASGTFTVTLPVTPLAGVRYTIKNTGTGVVTVAPSSTTIDGAATFLLSNQYDSIDLMFNTTAWSLV